jgi:hypothetical protein
MREVYRLAPDPGFLRSFDAYPDVVRIRASVPLAMKLAMALLVLFWTTTVVVSISTFVNTALDSATEGDIPGVPLVVATPPSTGEVAPSQVTPAPPFGVPSGAVQITGPVLLGDVADAIVFWHDAECANGLLTVFTNKVTLYREFDCTQLPPAEELARLPGQPVRIRTEGDVLLVEALFVGVFRFPPDRWWVVPV